MKIYKTLLLGFIFAIAISSSYAQQTPAPQFTEDKVLLQNIGQPWGMTFINKDTLLYTERSGSLFKYVISTNTRTPITGVPTVIVHGQGGLLDVAIHPNFAENSFVYLTYSVSVTGGQTTAMGRGKLVGNQLQGFEQLFRALPNISNTNHFGSRIAFDKDNNIYFSMGDRGTGTNAQDLSINAGKVMRLKDDGSVPADNPFLARANARPEIFTYGNRNVQGLALNPANGKIYAHEHGPRGGDELNVLKSGANYGWPLITFGIDYDGDIISEDTARQGLEQPITYWVPSIAPCGLVFIQNGQAADEADILIGALAGQHLHYLKLKNDKVVQSSKSMQGYARFRDVEQGPDGALYALTEEPNRLVRLKSNLIITATEVGLDDNSATSVYPNPGNEESTLRFNVGTSEKVQVNIISIDGKLLQTLADRNFSAGQHEIALAPTSLPKGIYQIEIIKGEKKSVVKWVKL